MYSATGQYNILKNNPISNKIKSSHSVLIVGSYIIQGYFWGFPASSHSQTCLQYSYLWTYSASLKDHTKHGINPWTKKLRMKKIVFHVNLMAILK